MRFSFAAFAFTDAALAHDSIVPHTHPHDVSALPDLLTLGIAVLMFVAAWFFARRTWRG